MRSVRNIIHFALVLAILSAGMPLYHPGDANRDDRVDLADAILRVQDLAQTAERSVSIRESLEDALITLSVVAGFQKVIKADRGAIYKQNTSHVNILAINSGCQPETLPPAGLLAEKATFLYLSPATPPPTPPPLCA